jgi:SAM-dependent methyltransferase
MKERARAWRNRPLVSRAAHPVRWGSLRRLAPIGAGSGAQRGMPIDRYYVDRFVQQRAGLVRGRVLEAETPELARRYGRDVERVDVLDVDAYNDDATLLADLGDAGSLPEAAFDCELLVGVLERVTNLDVAVSNAWRSVALGGALLVSVPTVRAVDRTDAGRGVDTWRMLPAGLQAILELRCPDGDVEVEGFGNVLAATALLMGVAAEELRPSELDHHDPEHPVVACGCVVKRGPV